MRLSGTREALKNAERELKERNILIQSLQLEIQKKPRCVDIPLGVVKLNISIVSERKYRSIQ